MYNILAIYPPGKSFQRGEDRCQIEINASTANSNRACNDLAYVSSILKKSGYNVIIRDYQVENSSLEHLYNDVKKFNPDVLFISTTNGSIFEDLKTVKNIKNIKNNIIVILKGAIFFNPDENIFEQLDLTDVDYLIGGEVEFIIDKLLNAHYLDKTQLKNLQGISYKSDGKWIINSLTNFNENLDSIPFPDRSKMRNELYINPETNKPMALITTDKGCCFSCSYCLSHIISGKKVRTRSNENILAELTECVNKYNITNFFFKSDTFTINKQKVIDFCKSVIELGLNKKINWVCTSRVDTIDEEMLAIMKQAGCSLLSIGFESGNNETLKLINKNTTVEQNLKIAKLCKKYGIKILGHFLIGFPWEDYTHLQNTKKHIFDINADYIEISVVVPYFGTQLYKDYINKYGKLNNILGSDSYDKFYEGFSKIQVQELQNFRKHILLKFYTRPVYILKTISKIKSIAIFFNYVKYGMRLIKNVLNIVD